MSFKTFRQKHQPRICISIRISKKPPARVDSAGFSSDPSQTHPRAGLFGAQLAQRLMKTMTSSQGAPSCHCRIPTRCRTAWVHGWEISRRTTCLAVFQWGWSSTKALKSAWPMCLGSFGGECPVLWARGLEFGGTRHFGGLLNNFGGGDLEFF